MSKAGSNAVMRIGLKLDPSVALEALIIHRLERLAKARHQNWLRSLLIKGFCAECAEIRLLQCESSGASTERYIPDLSTTPITRTENLDKAAPAIATSSDKALPAATTVPVALSALKAVLG